MSPPKPKRRRVWPAVAGVVVLGLILLIAFWNWDWFIPLADARASAALGRPVTITHLHVALGRQTRVAADGVTIANPQGFPSDPPFVAVGQLAATIDVMAFIHDRSIVIPEIEVTSPAIDAIGRPDGSANWQFPSAGGASSGPGPKIGRLVITDGHAKVVDPKVGADFHIDIATKQGDTPADDRIVVGARGTYAKQPIEASATGGALLSLREDGTAYPLDATVQNGPTKVTLKGTIKDPLHFAGADLTLDLTGPDMSLLLPLTGIAIPKTPPYSIAGKLDYAAGAIRFDDFAGRVGASDLEGDVAVKTGGARPDVTMKLQSKRVDLADLGGFLGSQPGRVSTPNQTPAERQAVARAEASPKLIPDKPISVPRLRAADIHLAYHAASIEGRDVPLDNLTVALDIEDGRIELHPVEFAVGKGRIKGTITLDPKSERDILADASIEFQRVDLSRLMQSTHLFQGGGTIGGTASLKTSGSSLATFLGNGDGGLKIAMAGGGDLSALLVDLSGLQLGNGILSALGVPNRARVECMVVDLGLTHGIVDTHTMLIDTSEGRVTGTGTIDLRNESLDYTLTTRAKHFSVGSLPGPIAIGGTFKDPSIRPGAETIARAGAAVGLGIIAAPLALLPTVQFGIGEDNACGRALKAERE